MTKMKRFAFPLLVVLFTGVSAVAQQKTVTIATVNNPAMIELKKLSPKFEAENPDIKLNWVVVEENILRQRVTTDISTGSGQFDWSLSVCMRRRFSLSADGLKRWLTSLPIMISTMSLNRSVTGFTKESCMPSVLR